MRQIHRLAILASMVSIGAWAQAPSTKNGEWPYYTGDLKGTRYSPLDQINASNSTSSKWRGASRPITSARIPSTSWKERR